MGAFFRRIGPVRAAAGILLGVLLLASYGAGPLAAQPFNITTPQPGQAPQPGQPQTPPPTPTGPSPFTPVPGVPPQTLPPQKVSDVQVRGNDHVSTATVLAAVATKPGDPLNEETLRNDVQSILGLGLFADVAVRLEPTADGVTVVFIVAENPVVTAVKITGNSVVSTADIEKAIGIGPGQVLNTVTMRQGAQAVNKIYQDRGYVLARVSDISVDDQGVLSVTIIEGKIEAIKFVGLHKTKEYVVRRNLTFKVGDVFNANEVNASFKKLYALKYFSDVKADPGPGTQPDTVDVTITVTEQKTSTLSFGAGYSTVDGIEGLVAVGDSDFGGNGQNLGIGYDTTSLNGSEFSVTFHEPYWMGRDTAFDFQAFNLITVPTDYQFGGLYGGFEYTMYQQGGQVTWTQPFGSPGENWQYGVKSIATQFGQAITVTSSTIPNNFVFTPGTVNAILLGAQKDTRNDPLNPTSGSELSINTQTALGGDFQFEKVLVDYVQYWPAGNAVVVGRVSLGAASGPLPIQEQFYLGGQNTLRGYVYGRFQGDNESLFTGEYRFPISSIPFLKSVAGLTGIIFADAGDTEPFGTLPTNLNVDYGVGIAAHTPLGLFRIDYGISSEGGQLWISTGTTF
ncbi:MAG TPA: POTRA domain-containing protein [bacterium]|nr:POTRA domain-containing protein [bacterium]